PEAPARETSFARPVPFEFPTGDATQISLAPAPPSSANRESLAANRSSSARPDLSRLAQMARDVLKQTSDLEESRLDPSSLRQLSPAKPRAP
ncbi:MAG TPA: hypothetical protein VNC50_15595, partial [Planctomycetia bacterium]|nr:hypothetical protein [Planctomycetia bacterium]